MVRYELHIPMNNNNVYVCWKSVSERERGQSKWPHQRETDEYNFIANLLDRFQAP